MTAVLFGGQIQDYDSVKYEWKFVNDTCYSIIKKLRWFNIETRNQPSKRSGQGMCKVEKFSTFDWWR